jgi:uncharacterized lipoprotein YddW (UPF0748 family)
MKKLVVILSIFYNLSFSQSLSELRGVWLTNVDSYVLSSDKSIADAMDFLADRGFNVVFPVVWNKGLTCYQSTLMDSLFQKPINPQYLNRDPLDRVVVEAHRNGIEVIPWFEFGFSPNYAYNLSDSGHILKKFPNWALLNKNKKLAIKNYDTTGFIWMSGINPQVQNFMSSLISEVINKYDIDGIQGDDRLPAMPIEGGYDSVTVSIYKSENSGNNPPSNEYDVNWKRWRGNKLNQYFRQLRNIIKTKGNHLILSSAPSAYPWGYDNYIQDSKTWVDSGIVDNFIPQLYRENLSQYTTELNNALSYVPQSKRNIFFAGVLAKAGTYLISPSLLLQSVALNRSKNVNGETYFFYEAFKQENNKRADTLKATYYTQPALLPYRNGNIFRPKAKILNEEDVGVTKVGNWVQVPVIGYKPNILRASDSSFASLTYNFDVPFNAWFSVYTYLVPNFIFTANARYTLYSGTDSSIVIINQQNSKNIGWVKIGDVLLTSGTKPVLKVDNSLVEAGKYLLADATMLMINRKLSPNVFVSDVESQKTNLEIKNDGFQLNQNYPNPFNPGTVISFSIESLQFVSLKVYDILGNEIATLVDGEKQPGNYKLKFDTRETPNCASIHSGVYFYQLRAGNFTQTKKMIYLK